MSREHWIDVLRIIGVAVILLYRNGVVSLPVLLAPAPWVFTH